MHHAPWSVHPVSDIEKAAFLVHLQYVHQAEAARRAGLKKQTTNDLKIRADALKAEHAKKGLPPPTLVEQVARKQVVEQSQRSQTTKFSNYSKLVR